MLKAAVAYNAAADHFDAAPLSFWSRHGTRAVDLLALQPGDKVLDVGCGTGASAIPAATTVGPAGRVLGFDVADKMLARARVKAEIEGLSNVRFDLRDMTAPSADLGSFDAVISVFSIFFVEDVEDQLVRLWDLLRPGGTMIVTVWGKNVFEPVASVFSDEMRRLRPDVPTGVRPWERLTDTDELHWIFVDHGLAAPRILQVRDQQPLTMPDDGWTIAMGSGYRWEIDQLSPSDKETLRRSVTARLGTMGVRAVETSAIHALATKPPIETDIAGSSALWI